MLLMYIVSRYVALQVLEKRCERGKSSPDLCTELLLSSS